MNEGTITGRAGEIFRAQEQANYRRTDRMFAWLMTLQWLAGIATAVWISPYSWEGDAKEVHVHVWAAIFLGGAISGLPVFLAIMKPGEVYTRHVIAVGQMLTSGLLIHLTGGRIETHFHVFGSLAFLAFYRDWKVLLTATAVVSLDHALRGIFWPRSAFGVLESSPWRWVEHAGWVIFEDVFLWMAIRQNLRVLFHGAEREARLEAVNLEIEQQVADRTAELNTATQNLLAASRMAGMAEIATNVIHNVGNVLNSVNVSAGVVSESVKKSKASSLTRAVALLKENEEALGAFFKEDPKGRQLIPYLEQLAQHLSVNQELTVKELSSLQTNIEHIKDIVIMQQDYARISGVNEVVDMPGLVEDSLRLNSGALTRHRVKVVKVFDRVPRVNLDKHKVLQVLTNLVRNAKYACDESKNQDRTLTLMVDENDGRVRVTVRDTGVGIPPENMKKIFQHGFTTRPGGHGFGLHGSALAAREMGGTLTAASDGPEKGATFVLEIPAYKPEVKA